MVEVTIQLPDELANALGNPPESLPRRVVEDLAIEEYRSGRLTHRQVGQILGLDYWQTEQFFQTRDVPLNYSEQDLESDLKTLRSIVRSK